LITFAQKSKTYLQNEKKIYVVPVAADSDDAQRAESLPPFVGACA
jgi:hypothetical protein